MNIFDILAAIALVWAVVNGWRNGLVSQLFSIAGVIAGLVLGYYFGGRVGAMLGVEEKFATIRNGKGISFAVPLSSVIGVNLYQFLSDNRQGRGV